MELPLLLVPRQALQPYSEQVPEAEVVDLAEPSELEEPAQLEEPQTVELELAEAPQPAVEPRTAAAFHTSVVSRKAESRRLAEWSHSLEPTDKVAQRHIADQPRRVVGQDLVEPGPVAERVQLVAPESLADRAKPDPVERAPIELDWVPVDFERPARPQSLVAALVL